MTSLCAADFAAGFVLAAADAQLGRWFFVGLFLAIAVCLILLPKSFLGDTEPRPWWKNVRFWAVVVAAVQMFIYAKWG